MHCGCLLRPHRPSQTADLNSEETQKDLKSYSLLAGVIGKTGCPFYIWFVTHSPHIHVNLASSSSRSLGFGGSIEVFELGPIDSVAGLISPCGQQGTAESHQRQQSGDRPEGDM